MSEQQNLDKVPWPGLLALQKCGMYHNGLIADRSGYDAINEWGRTASEAEKQECIELAFSLGYLEGWPIGWAVGTLVADAFFRWLRR